MLREKTFFRSGLSGSGSDRATLRFAQLLQIIFYALMQHRRPGDDVVYQRKQRVGAPLD